VEFDLTKSFHSAEGVQFDPEGLLMVLGDNGFFTSFCPNKIKIPELANVGSHKTSMTELDLPSPRLMQINFEKPFPVLNK
jgi:hypothetical protein